MKNKKIIFIGIVEDQNDKNTLKLLKNLLIQSNYRLAYSNRGEDILCLQGNDEVLVLIYIKLQDINIFQEYMGIKLDLLIYNFMEYKDNKQKFLNEQISNCDYCILNGDYINLISYPLEKLKGIVVTYGFNNKSSLTVSSCDTNGNIGANLYLQREIKTLKGERIEPQEFTIKSNESNVDSIYSILAATTLSLVLGNDIWTKSPDNIIKICI